MTKRNKILYAASTASHLRRFHMPYIEELKKTSDLLLMADGEGVDLPIRFDKHFFSIANLKSILKIHKILKREDFDLIVVHTTLAAFLVRAATFGLKKRPYIKNVVHGYLFSEQIQGKKEKVLLLCEKLMRNRTDEIIVMNEEDLRIAKTHRLCRGKISFINGMGLSDTLPIPEKNADLRREFAPLDSDILCAFVGELSARKNQRFLMEAVARLRKKGIPLKLLLLGEGSLRKQLEQAREELDLEDSVFLPGNREGVLPYLAVTDIYLSAAVSEGLPFNLLEAMHCGLPILATNVKGQSDLLPPEDLVPLGDLDAFCEKLEQLCKEKKGSGTRDYPNLQHYRLSSVLDENLILLSKEVRDEENA